MAAGRLGPVASKNGGRIESPPTGRIHLEVISYLVGCGVTLR